MTDQYPTLTAAETRQAEQVIFDRGVPVIDLMEEAGATVADAVREHFSPAETLVLCGPGNNGGDGYVIARLLREAGWDVRVAAFAEPGTEAAQLAKIRWAGSVETVDETKPAPILIDALFGTGLARAIDKPLADRLIDLVKAADHSVAVDLPSGVSTDDGALLNAVPQFDLTVALGVLKPAHSKGEGAARCGSVAVGDIGLVEAASEAGLV